MPPLGIDGIEGLSGGFGVDRGVDRPDGLGDGVAILASGIAEGAADQVDDAGLYHGVGEDGAHRLR
jgi:hypothetical protein